MAFQPDKKETAMIQSLKAPAIVSSIALTLTLAAAPAAAIDDETYWYAKGDPTVPDGQLWVTSYGECWQSAPPDGPTNLPPCQEEIAESITVAINFEFDEYIVPDTVVNPDVLVQIDEYIEQLQGTPENEYVTIVGHTDARGSDEYNMELGLRRADAVRDYIIRQGYPEANLGPAESLGKRDLIPDVDPFSVEQRRVVLTKTDG
jgi:OOP family OmpA-OmpF porin